jgi:hypothetical protein
VIRRLDFALLPIIEKMWIFTGMNQAIVTRMDEQCFFRETLDRARGAVMLFHSTPRTAESWLSGAYIRGGLAEFGSMEGALRRDLANAGIQGHAHAPCRSANPLVHLMQLLRNIEIHTSPAAIRPTKSMVRYPTPESPEVPLPIVVIEDLDSRRLLGRRETKKAYREQDLEHVVAWFNERQFDFGAQHLLGLGVELFSTEILEAHKAPDLT